MVLNISACERTHLIKALEGSLPDVAGEPLQNFFFLMLALLHDHHALEELTVSQSAMIQDIGCQVKRMGNDLRRASEAMNTAKQVIVSYDPIPIVVAD